MKCSRCGCKAEFFTDTCTEEGRKMIFFLCPVHQKEFRTLVEGFLEGGE